MKTKLLTILFLLGASGSSDLLAQETERRAERPRPSREQMHERMLQHFDKDGDGVLNEVERQEARASMQARRQEMQGRRGRSQGQEAQRRRGQVEGEQAQRRRGPADGEQGQRRRGPAEGEQTQRRRGREEAPRRDGLERPRREGQGQPQGRKRPSPEERRARLLHHFDANGDGQLDDTERAALKEAMQKRRAQAGQEGPTQEAKKGRGRQGRENVNAPRSDRRQFPR